jgi:nitrate reductase NapAB chaperone NapD
MPATDTEKMTLAVAGDLNSQLVVTDPPPEDTRRISDTLKALPGCDVVWESEDGTLKVNFRSKRQARGAQAYLASMYPLSEAIE